MDQQAKVAQEATQKREQLREELVTVYLALEKLPAEPLPLPKPSTQASGDGPGAPGPSSPCHACSAELHQAKGAGRRSGSTNHLRTNRNSERDGSAPGRARWQRSACQRASECWRRCFHARFSLSFDPCAASRLNLSPATLQSRTLHNTTSQGLGLPAQTNRVWRGWPANPEQSELDSRSLHCELGWPAPWRAKLGKMSGGKHGHQSECAHTAQSTRAPGDLIYAQGKSTWMCEAQACEILLQLSWRSGRLGA
eukprot:1748707-Amphidinium_carterae.1